MGAELGALETRRFPDGESYVRLLSDVAGREVIIVCTLARPDDQVLRLVFAPRVARELGAASLTMVAPYLAYMRQDKRFQPGEAVTSRYLADLLSRVVDPLETVDPQLRRHAALGEIYRIPAVALHAAPLLDDWISRTVEGPVVIGPDVESKQWVADVASRADAPYVVLQTERHGDRSVDVAIPDMAAWRDRQPVLIDDIVSSGPDDDRGLGGADRLGIEEARLPGRSRPLRRRRLRPVVSACAGDCIDGLRTSRDQRDFRCSADRRSTHAEGASRGPRETTGSVRPLPWR